MKVLLTTSGLGARLGDLTKFTNKSLVRVGKKPAISYTIESYPIETIFVITLGWFGQHVEQFLRMVYPERTFIFVNVDVYDGEGSSLAYSILKAERYLQEPFIFHACDTIIPTYQPIKNVDWVMGYKGSDTSHYVSFDTLGDDVVRLKAKGEMSSQFSYVGIAGIHHFKKFFDSLKKAMELDPNDRQLSDVVGLKSLNLKYLETKKWMDIGNVDGLMRARKETVDQFDILDKVDESIFILNDSVVKFFYNDVICANRIIRTQVLKGLVPELTDTNKNFYRYNFQKGDVLSRDCSVKRFEELLNWLKDNVWQPSGILLEKECRVFYKNKTKLRLDEFLSTSGIKDEPAEVNGLPVDSAFNLLNQLPWDKMLQVEGYRIHGDLILDNIIDDGYSFKLIDWRQDFGGNVQFGDIYYDLGKLNHNLIFNHDIINNGGFSVKGSPMRIDLHRSQRLMECQEVFFKWLKINNFNVQRVQIMSCIVWLNMAPLHQYPLNHFLYWFGRLQLQRVLNENI